MTTETAVQRAASLSSLEDSPKALLMESILTLLVRV